jgi:hypothetical protein
MDVLAWAETAREFDDDVGWVLLGGCYFAWEGVCWRQAERLLTVDVWCKDRTLGTARPRQLVIREVEDVAIEESIRVDKNIFGCDYFPDRSCIEIEGWPTLEITVRIARLDVTVLGDLGPAPNLPRVSR